MDWKSELMVAISDDDEAAVERILPRLEHIDDRVFSHLHLRHKLTLRMTKLKYTSHDTLLLLATRNGRVRAVEKLLSLGADVSSSDKDGKTAQQVGCAFDFATLVAHLIPQFCPPRPLPAAGHFG